MSAAHASCIVLSDPRLNGRLTDPQPLSDLIGETDALVICGPLLRVRTAQERSNAVRFMRRIQDVCDRSGTTLLLTGSARDVPLSAQPVASLAGGRIAVLPADSVDPPDDPAHDPATEWARLAELLERPAQSALRARLGACGLLESPESTPARPGAETVRKIAAAVHAFRSLPERLVQTAQRLVPGARTILTGVTTHRHMIATGHPSVINLASSHLHPLGLAALINGDHLRVVALHESGATAISIGRAALFALPLSTTTDQPAAPPAQAV